MEGQVTFLSDQLSLYIVADFVRHSFQSIIRMIISLVVLGAVLRRAEA